MSNKEKGYVKTESNLRLTDIYQHLIASLDYPITTPSLSTLLKNG